MSQDRHSALAAQGDQQDIHRAIDVFCDLLASLERDDVEIEVMRGVRPQHSAGITPREEGRSVYQLKRYFV